MTGSTYEDFVFIDASRRGVSFRTAASLKEMITDLLLNSGEEIALWGEGEAKRIADLWRQPSE